MGKRTDSGALASATIYLQMVCGKLLGLGVLLFAGSSMRHFILPVLCFLLFGRSL